VFFFVVVWATFVGVLIGKGLRVAQCCLGNGGRFGRSGGCIVVGWPGLVFVVGALYVRFLVRGRLALSLIATSTPGLHRCRLPHSPNQ